MSWRDAWDSDAMRKEYEKQANRRAVEEEWLALPLSPETNREVERFLRGK